MRKFNPEYVSYEELYKAYLDCRKRKRSTYNAIEFEMDENYNLFKLYEALNGLIYKIGRSIAFCVDKPVKREVFAADFRDRIVHHLVINRLENMFEEEFINDSYSCRKGKGTDYWASAEVSSTGACGCLTNHAALNIWYNKWGSCYVRPSFAIEAD